MANPPPKIRWAIFIGIALLTLLVRLPRLDERPMHTDEAVNAYITGQLLAGDSFQYDPEDRHGPTLYLAALPVVRSAGAQNLAEMKEVQVRLVPVIFSVLIVLLLAVVASQIGFIAALVTALFFAAAPLPVFYSRYFIHEMLFIAGSIGFALAAWRTVERKSLRAAIAMGACAAWMLACKETALLHFAAFAVPAVWWIWIRRSDLTRRSARWSVLLKPALIALVSFGVIVLALYTWGGKNWQGPADLIRSIPRFAQRAGGEGHEKPFWYYFVLLTGGGFGAGLFALAIPALVQAARTGSSRLFNVSAGTTDTRNLALQLLALYALAIFAAYCVIPYKNPWLALNLWIVLALLAGAGFQLLWFRFAKLPVRTGLVISLAVLLAGSGFETKKWVFRNSSSERNPYAYAHTVEDILGLQDRIAKLAADANNSDAKIAVIASDPWPLPWYLRKFQHVGYYQLSQTPAPADFYITSLEAAERMESALDGWRSEFFGVRPEVLILLWKKPAHE